MKFKNMTYKSYISGKKRTEHLPKFELSYPFMFAPDVIYLKYFKLRIL